MINLNNKKRRAFTITELVFVLGIAGIIIGGIFVAGSKTQSRLTANQASDELNKIANNIRDLYAGRNVSYAALGPPVAPNYAAYMPNFIAQNIFPAEMNSGGIINNIWNLTSATHTALVSLVGSAGAPVEFVVEYKNLTSSQCVDLIMLNSAPGRETGLVQISVNGTILGVANNTAKPLPVSKSKANNACGGTAPFAVDWYYNLGV